MRLHPWNHGKRLARVTGPNVLGARDVGLVADPRDRCAIHSLYFRFRVTLVSDRQVRENLEAMHIQFLVDEILRQWGPHSSLARAPGVNDIARALFNLGWRPPGYCQCAAPALDSTTPNPGSS